MNQINTTNKKRNYEEANIQPLVDNLQVKKIKQNPQFEFWEMKQFLKEMNEDR